MMMIKEGFHVYPTRSIAWHLLAFLILMAFFVSLLLYFRPKMATVGIVVLLILVYFYNAYAYYNQGY